MIVISAQRAGISNSSFHSDRTVHMRWALPQADGERGTGEASGGRSRLRTHHRMRPQRAGKTNRCIRIRAALAARVLPPGWWRQRKLDERAARHRPFKWCPGSVLLSTPSAEPVSPPRLDPPRAHAHCTPIRSAVYFPPASRTSFRSPHRQLALL